MRIFHIHNQFAALRDTLLNLPECRGFTATVLQDNRNVVTKVEGPDGIFVIKDFRGMYFLNRFAYSIFRKSKAIRSFEHSERLNAMGIQTPGPVAWIDDYAAGLLTRSIFISSYLPYQTLQQYMQDTENEGPDFKITLLKDLAAFALNLHQKGVYHEDFSIGNIFVIPKRDGYDFGLTDLNRMRFLKTISYNEAMNNFRKKQFRPGDLNTFISSYARLTSHSPNDSLTVFHRLKERSSRLRRARRKLRHYTLGMIESMRPQAGKPESPVWNSRNKIPNSMMGKRHELQSPNQSTSQKAVSQPHPKHS